MAHWQPPGFIYDGDHWTVSYGQRVIHLRDDKGMRCLAVLLHHPGRTFAAVELLEIAAQPASDSPQAPKASSPHASQRFPAPERSADRTAKSTADTERARVLATKLIKGAIKRIASYHPDLGAYLGRTIKTGRHCAYAP